MCAQYELIAETCNGKVYEVKQTMNDGSIKVKYQIDFGNILMTLYEQSMVFLKKFVISVFEQGIEQAKVYPSNKVLIHPKGFVGYYALTEDELLEMRDLLTTSLDCIEIDREIKRLFEKDNIGFDL